MDGDQGRRRDTVDVTQAGNMADPHHRHRHPRDRPVRLPRGHRQHASPPHRQTRQRRSGARDDRDRYGRYLRYLDVDGTDAGQPDQAGFAVARYDSRDGYGNHPREASYLAADAASPKAPCSTVATPPPLPSKPANPAPAPVPVSPSKSWPLAGDQNPCPHAKPIKGNQSSMIAHSPGQQSYLITNPEACFANLTDAAAAGYRPAKR